MKSFKKFKEKESSFLYEKNPVQVEAIQWGGERFKEDDPKWLLEAMLMGIVVFEYDDNDKPVVLIETAHGIIRLYEGDYIIQGVNGEIYPCSNDIFKKSYEKVL